MRKYMTENQLLCIASDMAESIVIRSYENGCSGDDRRETTMEESERLFRLFYGTLLGMNWNRKADTQGIIDTVEFIAHQLFSDYETENNIEINWYDSAYLPLQKVVREWEEE